MTSKFWHWPDRNIGKRESRKLREEHNALANSHAELIAALQEAIRWLDVMPIEYRKQPRFPGTTGRALIAKATQ